MLSEIGFRVCLNCNPRHIRCQGNGQAGPGCFDCRPSLVICVLPPPHHTHTQPLRLRYHPSHRPSSRPQRHSRESGNLDMVRHRLRDRRQNSQGTGLRRNDGLPVLLSQGSTTSIERPGVGEAAYRILGGTGAPPPPPQSLDSRFRGNDGRVFLGSGLGGNDRRRVPGFRRRTRPVAERSGNPGGGVYCPVPLAAGPRSAAPLRRERRSPSQEYQQRRSQVAANG